mgnify:CR=1 FL=1
MVIDPSNLTAERFLRVKRKITPTGQVQTHSESVRKGDRMQLEKSEQETIIEYNAESDIAEVVTYEPALARKLDRLVRQHPDQASADARPDWMSGKDCRKWYYIPKSWIKIDVKTGGRTSKRKGATR